MMSEKIKMRSIREGALKSTQEKTKKYNANVVGAGLVPAQNNHAITLIALIITIIILLIIAGVTLNLTLRRKWII